MSGVVMKMKMSPTDTGKLFQKSMRLEEEIAELKAAQKVWCQESGHRRNYRRTGEQCSCPKHSAEELLERADGWS